MAPEALARRLIAALLVCGCVASGCKRNARDVTVIWNIEPTPPISGAATIVRLRLQEADGNPVRGAKLRLQGHMAHPGMAPVTGGVSERGDGAYEGSLQLSMAGDWVFVVSGELADGRRISKEIQVASVRRAS